MLFLCIIFVYHFNVVSLYDTCLFLLILPLTFAFLIFIQCFCFNASCLVIDTLFVYFIHCFALSTVFFNQLIFLFLCLDCFCS